VTEFSTPTSTRGETDRRLAERAHKNILQWSEYNADGHYAAHQVPELLVGDVRNFFRVLK
jgi:hypothetical protein